MEQSAYIVLVNLERGIIGRHTPHYAVIVLVGMTTLYHARLVCDNHIYLVGVHVAQGFHPVHANDVARMDFGFHGCTRNRKVELSREARHGYEAGGFLPRRIEGLFVARTHRQVAEKGSRAFNGCKRVGILHHFAVPEQQPGGGDILKSVQQGIDEFHTHLAILVHLPVEGSLRNSKQTAGTVGIYLLELENTQYPIFYCSVHYCYSLQRKAHYLDQL